MALNIAPSSDGRRQRSERSQTAIIEAALSLMNEGTLVPTAQQIADRAGVGIRSFFRHFADMDSLFLAADDMLLSSYEALFEVDNRAGTLSERVTRSIDLYGNAFEKLRPIILCTQAQLWRSPKLRENYGWHQKRLRKELELWLPEVAELPKDRREAVHAVASFSMWNRLREFQGLSIKTSADIVTSLVNDLIASN
jgi:AcrR family transcriptional regulator